MSKAEFNWVTPVLYVENMIPSLQYYQEVLGFDINWQWSEETEFEQPAHPTFACVGRGEISLFLCEQGQGNPGSWLCLNVNTLDELSSLYQEYQQSGAKIIQEPKDFSWGMREMLVKDIDDNVFRMGCPLPCNNET